MATLLLNLLSSAPTYPILHNICIKQKQQQQIFNKSYGLLRGLEPSLWISLANLAFSFLLKVTTEKCLFCPWNGAVTGCSTIYQPLIELWLLLLKAVIADPSILILKNPIDTFSLNCYISINLLWVRVSTGEVILDTAESIYPFGQCQVCAMKTMAKCLHTYSITTLTVTGGKVQDEFLDEHLFYFRKTKCRDSTTKAQKVNSWISLRPWEDV